MLLPFLRANLSTLCSFPSLVAVQCCEDRSRTASPRLLGPHRTPPFLTLLEALRFWSLPVFCDIPVRSQRLRPLCFVPESLFFRPFFFGACFLCSLSFRAGWYLIFLPFFPSPNADRLIDARFTSFLLSFFPISASLFVRNFFFTLFSLPDFFISFLPSPTPAGDLISFSLYPLLFLICGRRSRSKSSRFFFPR